MDFALSVAIWGYHIAGDCAEPTAWLCESRDLPPPMEAWRDKTAAEPGWWRCEGDGEYEPAPLFWKLPGVTELRFREAVAV